MEKYFIESKHTQEECLRALDEILAKGPDALSKVEWGCMAGDHTGYSIVEARSDSRVWAMYPVRVVASRGGTAAHWAARSAERSGAVLRGAVSRAFEFKKVFAVFAQDAG